jgi:hypothetical protein
MILEAAERDATRRLQTAVRHRSASRGRRDSQAGWRRRAYAETRVAIIAEGSDRAMLIAKDAG